MCWLRTGVIVFFKQKTAYEMRISDWSSDVCSSDLAASPFSDSGSGLPAHRGHHVPRSLSGPMRWPGLLADRLQRPKPGRILVVGTVAAVIVAIAVWFTTAERSNRPGERSPATTIARDPLEAELVRCHAQIGRAHV